MIVNDPNVNTGGSTAPTQRQFINSNYQDFLKLLTTQLQNQDPTNPTDTTQLTQQIATLSQVEQQIGTNDKLGQLVNLYSSTQYNSLVSYIGKQIEAEGDSLSLKDGKAAFAYYLASDADTVKVTIKDKDGQVVWSGPGERAAGRNEFGWNGKNSAGEALPNGTYTVTVEAKGPEDQEIASRTYITGIVTSVDLAAGQTYLSVDDVSIPLQSIVSIRAPQVASAPPAGNDNAPSSNGNNNNNNNG